MSAIANENINKCKKCNATRSEKKLSKCSRCGKVFYCSKNCQKEDWNEHKKNCVDKKNKISDSQEQQQQQEESNSEESEFKFVDKISMLRIFDKVIDSCCSKTLYEVAFKNYLLLEIENGKDVDFIKECLLDEELKPNLAMKGIIYYFRKNMCDRYFCTKVVNSLLGLIKNINNDIPDKEAHEISDSFFKYIEKNDINYDSMFTISAYEMNIRSVKAIIFRCSV